MGIGLKLKSIRRFGQKLKRGVHTFARKVANSADIVGAIATPFATAIGGPAGAAAVQGAVQGVKKVSRGVARLTDKGVDGGERLFKQIQQPVLGARELVRDVKTAVKNPEQGQIMIGDTLVKRFGAKDRSPPSIQRTDAKPNDWNELPFAE